MLWSAVACRFEMSSAPQFKRLRADRTAPAAVDMPAGFALGGEDVSLESSMEELIWATPEFREISCDCMSIYLTPAAEVKAMEPAMQETEEGLDFLRQLEFLPGKYWKVADYVNNLPCFKKETHVEARSGEMVQLYMWYDHTKMKGWVITEIPLVADDEITWAWAPRQHVDMIPKSLHIPFWAKRKSPLVSPSCDDG